MQNWDEYSDMTDISLPTKSELCQKAHLRAISELQVSFRAVVFGAAIVNVPVRRNRLVQYLYSYQRSTLC
jgi:hypothetical protein